MAELSIARLRDHGDALETVAGWIDREWGKFSGRSLQQTRERFAQEFTCAGLPTSCVALDGRAAVGVATLRERDSVDWDAAATPWICNVFVCDAARSQGVARRLCVSLESIARELGYTKLYLATVMAADSLYHRLGYKRYRTHETSGSPMYLMHRKLEA